MTTASPIRIELVSTPSTNNTLDPQERSRLLKSTRKLEAVLGTTPLVIEALGPARRKREGGIYHSPSSSISSVEDLMIMSSRPYQKSSSVENDYVFVRSNGRSAPYQHQYIPPPSSHLSPGAGIDSRAASAASFYDASPSSSRSASPIYTPKKQRRSPPGHHQIDLSLALDMGSSGKSNSKSKSKGPQPLSQPLLLRLRSVPTDPKSTSTSSPPQTRITRPYPALPLSPANSTFTIDTTVSHTGTGRRNSVSSPPASPRTRTKSNALTDREKRRKMAKLARTLGENVPPELVFGQSRSGKRRSSVCGAFVANGGVNGMKMKPRVQPLIVGEAPVPATTTSTTPSTTSSPTSLPLTITVSREIETAKCGGSNSNRNRESFLDLDSPSLPSTKKELGVSGKGKRKHRPRSLTLGSSSAFAAFPQVPQPSVSKPKARSTNQTRGTTSLDVQRPSRPSSSEDRPLPPLPLRVQTKIMRHEEPAFSRVELMPMDMPGRGSLEMRCRGSEESNRNVTGGLNVHGNGGLNAEVAEWRRKEREWSGEWNLRDMEEVTKALRMLK